MLKKILIGIVSIVALLMIYGTFFKEKTFTVEEAKKVAKYSELKALQKAIAYRLKYHELETNGATKEEKFELLKDWLLPKPNYKDAKYAWINSKNEHMYLEEKTNSKGEKEVRFTSKTGALVTPPTYYQRLGYASSGTANYNLNTKLNKVDLQRLRFTLFAINIQLLPYNGDSDYVEAGDVAPFPETDAYTLYELGLEITGTTGMAQKTLDKYINNPFARIDYGMAIGFEKAAYEAKRHFEEILEPLDSINKRFDEFREFDRKRNIIKPDSYYIPKTYTVAEMKQFGEYVFYHNKMYDSASRLYGGLDAIKEDYKPRYAFLDRNVYKGINFEFNDLLNEYGIAFPEDNAGYTMAQRGVDMSEFERLEDTRMPYGYLEIDYLLATQDKEYSQRVGADYNLAKMENSCKMFNKEEIHIYMKSLYLSTISMPDSSALREEIAAHNRRVTNEDKLTRAHGKTTPQRVRAIFNSFEFSKTPEAKDWHEAFDYWEELWRAKGLDQPFDRIASFSGHLV